MTLKLPQVPARKLVKAIERKEFKFKNQMRSHKVFKHPDGRRTTVIDHGNTPVNKSVLKRIMRDTGIEVEDLK